MQTKIYRKEVNMKFTKKMKEFILASGRFVNSTPQLLTSTREGLYFPIDDLEYCSPGDGKKNIGGDFAAVGNDFKKATKEAQNEVRNGKATVSK